MQKDNSKKNTRELKDFLDNIDELWLEEVDTQDSLCPNTPLKVTFSYSYDNANSTAEKVYESIKNTLQPKIDEITENNNDLEKDEYYEREISRELDKITRFSAQKCFEKGIKVPFHSALSFLEAGFAITRSCWEDDPRVVYMVPGSHFQATRFPLSELVFTGESVEYLPHLDMVYLNDNTAKTWTPSNEDLFAKDWMVFCDLNKEE